MRVLVACDSFKGSCSAWTACQGIARGIQHVHPDWEIDGCPLADGGEGTLAAVAASLDLHIEQVTVTGPIGVPVAAEIAWTHEPLVGISDRAAPHERATTAWLESATCLGLALVPPERRNPLQTTSYGLGQLLNFAKQQGARSMVIGLGGSATVDAGIGLAQALGLEFAGVPTPAGGGELAQVTTIAGADAVKAWADVRVLVATDVRNPLLGARGAAQVFAPQKGATPAMVAALEGGIEHYARRLCDTFAVSDGLHPLESAAHFAAAIAAPGAGAAGGLGFALMQLLNAQMVSGIELVMNCVHFAERVVAADYVITGEGKLDVTSFEGKVVSGVLAAAANYGKPVAVICGTTDLDAATCAQHGISSCKRW